MSWDAAFPEQAQRNALDLAARPLPPQPRRASGWEQVGAFVGAPFTGAAAGLTESLRAGYTAATAGADEVMRRQQQEADDFTAEAIFRRRLELDDERASVQSRLRARVESFRPSPEASNIATQFVFDAARVLTKIGAYTALTRNPLAVAGLTGADEGVTGFSELRDEGVDPATAAKVGAVRGVSTAIGVALPAAGKTTAQTLGLIALGGPGSQIVETAAARQILRDATYDEIAERFDPFDPAGLIASTLVSGTVGAVAARNAARARRAPTADQVDAAHVVVREAHVAEQTLGNSASIADANAHARALRAAREAMDEGRTVDVAAIAPVDAVRAEAQAGPLREVLQQMDREQPEAPRIEPLADELPPVRVEGAAAEAPSIATPLRAEADRIVDANPNLLLRAGDGPDAPTVRAADLLIEADRASREAEIESRAYQAAISCAIRTGT